MWIPLEMQGMKMYQKKNKRFPVQLRRQLQQYELLNSRYKRDVETHGMTLHIYLEFLK